MGRVDSLLAESDLSAVAFNVIERFSPHRSVQEAVAELMSVVGASVRLWADAQCVYHVFVNPQMGATGQCHRLRCVAQRGGTSATSSPCAYEEIQARPPVPKFTALDAQYSWRPRTYRLPADQNEDLVRVAVPSEMSRSHQGAVHVACFDFVNSAPLGFFVAAWIGHEPPPESELLQIQNALWNLARVVSALLCNHYTIHENTYLPAYQLEGDKSVAILFADIRNSTTLFEVARIARSEAAVEALLRAWFRYAAELITRTGLGSLHRFTGDGLVATFGEYVIGTPTVTPDETACVLSLHAARQLLDAFARLYRDWRSHDKVARFLRDQNEDVEIRLGVGLNCGEVHFAYIGRPSTAGSTPGTIARPGDAAHLEYCAFGDHMNTTARLADIATKRCAEIDVANRGTLFAGRYRMAPIIASHRTAERLRSVLGDATDLDARRGRANLRGKGIGLSFYEIDATEVDRARCADRIGDVSGGYFRTVLHSVPKVDDYVESMVTDLEQLPDQ
jgi:class 3 adenylate cyclase